ncbi:Laminin subunit beta-4 [Nosema bombycis CQ1]|uniref:Laminin subunit beta-4 n=2 Tax=Nosema bombycis TaxID=27978 RepID=R0MNT8_NOSB1|nr:SAS-6 centriolar assembly protein [Nosema bombycis]EOB14533.1 Laminin subunit beta-4 [Nosema bombycis CQ1]|eukprot:EOB14533.1 Laminin subunit beta-4 [Nosema bombycis CQ1]
MKEILFTGKIPITSSNEDIPWQMKCDITRSDDLVEVRLIDTRDIFTFYVCNLSQSDFYILKREQDLIVDYESFIPILVKLFHGILTKRLFALFSKETTKFMFVEKSEFRNIIRLELPFLKPDESHFKRYLSDIIERMESYNIKLIKENGMLKEQCINGDKQMKDKISYLEGESSSLKIKLEKIYKESDKLNKENLEKDLNLKDLKNKIFKLEKDNNELNYDLEKSKLEIVKNQGIKSNIDNYEKEIINLKKEIETANEIIKDLKEENKEIKSNKEHFEEENLKIKKSNENLKKDLEDFKKKLKNLINKNKQLEEENEKIIKSNENLKKEGENIKKKLENAQSVYNHFYNKKMEIESIEEEDSGIVPE